MVLVELWAWDGVGLIVPWPSGVFWTNQVGSCACAHPEVEGFFVPLHDLRQDKQLAVGEEHWWGSDYDASAVSRLLEQLDLADHLEPDTDAPKMAEAWVSVRIKPTATMPALEALKGRRAILTYTNSD